MFLLLWTISRCTFPEGVVFILFDVSVSCIVEENAHNMGKLSIFTARLATLLLLHAARTISRVAGEWLPTDNQTTYKLGSGESRSLELNTSSVAQAIVYITVSPCMRDFQWALYYEKGGNNGHLIIQKEDSGGEMSTFSIVIQRHDRYVLKLSSTQGGAAMVSVRGEATRQVRLRLRVRSRRRLAAYWDPSPIDPQATTYCVVASHRRNYTSLCAAQYDIKASRLEHKSNRLVPVSDRLKIDRWDSNSTRSAAVSDVDNKIEVEADSINVYEGNFKNIFRRKKIGRSTKVADEDPVVACVGDRTHHLIENLDPNRTYFVSVFGVAKDRRSGSLLATGRVRPRTSTAKRLRENVSNKSEIRGRSVYYFKTTVGMGGGAWFTLSTCNGAVDVEVLVRGKKLFTGNIDPHSKFFVSAPMATSSMQETSDEGSVQFDSSSEEAKIRYVIKITPTRWDRDSSVGIEITVSTTRWGTNTPELSGDGAVVRELRPRRSCRSTYIAFLPATHNATDVIRYCIIARETVIGESNACLPKKKSAPKPQCSNHLQTHPPNVIVQKIGGLKSGRKYAIQVLASNKGSSVPYKVLYVDTNMSCKEE